jgi:hypothetical protein
MTPIVEFLKVLGKLLRTGKMSYDDALKRFKSQYGRNAEGVEKTAIKNETQKTKLFEGFKPKVVPKEKIIFDKLIKGETTIDDLVKGPVVSDGVKGKRVWDFSKKQKKGEVVDLFASEKEFKSDLYSIRQNFIQNDPMFNLELAVKFRNPGTKTYGWTPTGDRSKLHSPKQRQQILDDLKEIMKHDTYQTQHAEDFLLEDGSLFKLTDDMFIIEKAEGGIARLGMAGGGALFKFIEKLFIKASNDIRLGRGSRRRRRCHKKRKCPKSRKRSFKTQIPRRHRRSYR